MNRNQAAGHLGAANNPTVGAQAKHSSRQQLMVDAQKSSGVSQPKIAGLIGATTNPQLTQQTKHEARKSVMDAVCPSGPAGNGNDSSPQTSDCSSQTSTYSSKTSSFSSQTSDDDDD
jgi:hypothetical protein